MDRACRIGEARPTSLPGIAEQAKNHPKDRVRHRDGMRNEERRKDCWRALRQEAAYGVDAVSAPAYEQDVDDNISHLVERRKRKRDRATLVRRHDSPKGDGKLRPVGIPAVADQLRQLAVTRLLTALDAQDVRRCR